MLRILFLSKLHVNSIKIRTNRDTTPKVVTLGKRANLML